MRSIEIIYRNSTTVTSQSLILLSKTIAVSTSEFDRTLRLELTFMMTGSCEHFVVVTM